MFVRSRDLRVILVSRASVLLATDALITDGSRLNFQTSILIFSCQNTSIPFATTIITSPPLQHDLRLFLFRQTT